MSKLSNKKKKLIVLFIILLLIGVPILIHCLFKIKALNDFWVAEWSAGDILSYCGSMILGLVTIILAYVAIKQTQMANYTSNRMLDVNEMQRRALLKINISECSIENSINTKFITICFENVTDNLIVNCNINKSEKIIIENNWEYDKESREGINITNFKLIGQQGLIEEGKKLVFGIEIDKYTSNNLLISFKTICESIYGLESIQSFNILLLSDNIIGYKTMFENND